MIFSPHPHSITLALTNPNKVKGQIFANRHIKGKNYDNFNEFVDFFRNWRSKGPHESRRLTIAELCTCMKMLLKYWEEVKNLLEITVKPRNCRLNRRKLQTRRIITIKLYLRENIINFHTPGLLLN